MRDLPQRGILRGAPTNASGSQNAATFRMTRATAKLAMLLIGIFAGFACAARAASVPAEQVWLAVSDVHLDIFDHSLQPSPNAADGNPMLLESAVAQMKRAVRNPAVILLPGDFLVHHFRERAAANGGAPDATAIRTMRWIAQALKRAFPNAQFAIALGNNDAPCGDYRSDDGSPYLTALARIWAPLVNRNGASPGFEASFVRGGYYTTRLPVRGLRLVVLDTVPLSREYRGDCGGDESHAGFEQLAWLQMTLQATPRGMHNVVMMHIPPGFDAFSTDYLHGFLTWPFLQPQYDRTLVSALEAPGSRVLYAIAGHVHRFDYRLAGRVPIVVLGSLSPIYGNNPTFYALRVLPDGSLRDIDIYAFDESIRMWLKPRSFDRTWGLTRIDAVSLSRLHARLANASASRALWDQQANGWPTDQTVGHGAWQGVRWRVSWCAQSIVVSGFAQCARIERRVRTLHVLGDIAILATALTILVVILRIRVIGRLRV